MRRRWILSVVLLFLLSALFPYQAIAAETGSGAESAGGGTITLDLSAGSITVKAKKEGIVFIQNGSETVSADGSAILRQSSADPTGNTVTVSSGSVTLTIVDLNVVSSNPSISISRGAKLTLNLMGSSSLTATNNSYPGIRVYDTAELEIRGSGAVTAKGGKNGAGIGGGSNGTCGTVTIHGGTVTATGGENGAGIGGGNKGSGGTVTIHGGTVTAVGGSTGIGGGNNGYGGAVTINGGSVTARGTKHAIGGGVDDTENIYGCDRIAIAREARVTAECSSADPAVLSNFTPYQERISFEIISDTAALSGNRALFSVTASGHSGLSYQWQYSADNVNWTSLQGQTSTVAYIPVSAENDGHYYRCRLTNGWGNVVYTGAAQAYVLRFTQHPESMEISAGETALLRAVSSCAKVSYLWQRSLDGGASWRDLAGETYASLLVNATLNETNVLYRCIITAANGDSLASDAARLMVPNSGTIYTTRFYLEREDGSGYELVDQLVAEAAAGSVVTAGVKTFDHYSENTAKGTHSGTVRRDNSLVLSRYYDRLIYTVSYDANGGAGTPAEQRKTHGVALTLSGTVPTRSGCTFLGWAESSTALAVQYLPGDSYTKDETTTLYAVWKVDPVTITKQPVSVAAKAGTYVKFSLEAKGSNLRYQWQYWNGEGWSNTGDDWNSSTDTMSFQTWPEGNGLCFRCVVWNAENGEDWAASDTVGLTVVPEDPVTITRQPVSVKAKSGTYATYRIEATGANLRYQWQYWNGQGWSNTGDDWNSATDTMSFRTWDGGNGLCFRCVVWNAENSADYAFSETVALTVTSSDPVKITRQPVSVTAKSGAYVIYRVEATGANLRYQWQYWNGEGWSNTGDDWNSASKTMSFQTWPEGSGLSFRCVVWNAENGEDWAVSDTVSLTVTPTSPVTITRQPVSVTVSPGAYVTYRVVATGENLRYQWQYWNGKDWSNTGDDWNSSTHTMSFLSWPGGSGLSFRCVVWNAENSADWAVSDTVSLTVN
ncbi:MAG: InlB B-repeat-containing protein [Oscillospiraceae bacterium]|nr:InlB B-repeat-containing protein [Oscillospiraceae bacterium]